jgi:hypothetical protein
MLDNSLYIFTILCNKTDLYNSMTTPEWKSYQKYSINTFFLLLMSFLIQEEIVFLSLNNMHNLINIQ